jgi:hypothetical protein
MKPAEDFTYRDVDALLRQVLLEGGRVPILTLLEGAEPGFHFAVRSLMGESVCSDLESHTLGGAQTAIRRSVFFGIA